MGDKVSVANDRAVWLDALANFEISLYRNGNLVDKGHARNVLDGPLFAIKHLLDLLKNEGGSTPVAAGEIVTTGTVTKAFPVEPGERWHTEVARLPLPAVSISFARA
jgi:2-oxo-3-hexenedioate decarboxylase